MIKTIPDFDGSEIWTIRTTLKERYGQNIEVQLADTQVTLNNDNLWCPTVYWYVEPVHFVIFKTGLGNYRCNFFYNENEQYGTGIEEFDNISECLVTLLQVQQEHEKTT
ncbi:hypothetical protein QUF74_15595 [Candidatus Halobeggiatoa sp. HSG11]|nr:hypothetical protein [Candidatus Halobeggiatoa sp. HSG11]